MAFNESKVAAGTRQSEETVTREEIVALFDRRQSDWDDLDAAALAADYTEDCVVASPFGGTHEGRTAVERVLRAFFEPFPDLKMRSESLLIDGNQVAQLMSAEGTDIGGFMGVPATGKPFRAPCVLLYELRGRQIARERRIYDFTGVLMQIGVLKAKPV